HSTSKVIKGKSIRLFSDEKVPIQVDGENAGFTPADIEILPKRLLVKS
ncbi:hypothetical protein HY605_04680, partial [Candidatus Peregrinibacteria bacterium]|nr:hypothetical protein [Candidatus Peregrinibacteria bacterium]